MVDEVGFDGNGDGGQKKDEPQNQGITEQAVRPFDRQADAVVGFGLRHLQLRDDFRGGGCHCFSLFLRV